MPSGLITPAIKVTFDKIKHCLVGPKKPVLRQNVVNVSLVPTTVLGMQGVPGLRHLRLSVSKRLAEDLGAFPEFGC